MRKMLLLACLTLPLFAQVRGTPELEEIVVACAARDCADQPRTAWDLPACSDYDLDTALIEAMKYGDASATSLLQQRRLTTFTRGERERIGNALLLQHHDSSALWDELYSDGENALLSDDDVRAFCAQKGYDENGYKDLAFDALATVMRDARAHALTLRALASHDSSIAAMAVLALGFQHDESSLDAIEKAIQRFDGTDRQSLAFTLSAYRSAAADAIASRYLSADVLNDYRQTRDGGLQ